MKGSAHTGPLMPSKVPSSDKTEALFSKTEALFSTNDWREIKVAERQARSHIGPAPTSAMFERDYLSFSGITNEMSAFPLMNTCLLFQLGRNVCFSAFCHVLYDKSLRIAQKTLSEWG